MARSAPSLTTGVGLVLRPDGDDHLGTEGLGELDRHGADAGRAAMDQQCLAGLQCPALEHIVPHRHQGLRGGAGLLHRERRRHRHRLGVLRQAILRVAAARDQRHHLVAEPVLAGVGSDRNHFARDLEAGQIAGAGRRRIAARSLRDIGTVHPGCGHPDQDFVRARRRYSAGLGYQHVGAAGLADADDGHLRGQLFHDLSLRKTGILTGS